MGLIATVLHEPDSRGLDPAIHRIKKAAERPLFLLFELCWIDLSDNDRPPQLKVDR